jgi:hypothetical protein
MQAPSHQINSSQHFGIENLQGESNTLFKDTVQLMPIAPESNKVFVPKAPTVEPKDPVYHKFVSSIDR